MSLELEARVDDALLHALWQLPPVQQQAQGAAHSPVAMSLPSRQVAVQHVANSLVDIPRDAALRPPRVQASSELVNRLVVRDPPEDLAWVTSAVRGTSATYLGLSAG